MKKIKERTPKSKTEIQKKPRSYNRKSGVSTRDVILEKASEIINRTGVVDFRIEALASSLELSPGNITYHFPKKEDIITSIWDNYITSVTRTPDLMLTPLLDIKQLFLSYRTAALKTIEHLGVAVYHFGDMGMLRDANKKYIQQTKNAKDMVFESYRILAHNGYIKPIEDPILLELTFEAQFTTLRWWYNHAMSNVADTSLVVNSLDQYIAMSIYPLFPFLTEKGMGQFESILDVLKD